jgi:hypothetical protein
MEKLSEKYFGKGAMYVIHRVHETSSVTYADFAEARRILLDWIEQFDERVTMFAVDSDKLSTFRESDPNNIVIMFADRNSPMTFSHFLDPAEASICLLLYLEVEHEQYYFPEADMMKKLCDSFEFLRDNNPNTVLNGEFCIELLDNSTTTFNKLSALNGYFPLLMTINEIIKK